MGVIHKLKSTVIEFILAQKERDPTISCRKLVPLVKKKFKKEVSKSSINSVLKKGGESSPVGKQAEVFIDCAGALFLKAADQKLGASFELTEAVKNKLTDIPAKTIQAYNQALIFMRVFGINEPANLNKYQGSGLWILTGLDYDRFLPSKINHYYNSLCNKSLYYSIAMRSVSLYTRVRQAELSFAKEETIPAELEVMLLNLTKLCQREFFPSIYWGLDYYQMRQQFFSLAGFLRRSKNNLIIRLAEHKSLDLQLDLAHACRKFNEAEIKTISGQRFSLQPPI